MAIFLRRFAGCKRERTFLGFALHLLKQNFSWKKRAHCRDWEVEMWREGEAFDDPSLMFHSKKIDKQ